MDKSFDFDTFNLCWAAILEESKQFNYTFFSEDHCKLLDSRDTNFNNIESRLAYTYTFGHFNINYVEKCISNFLIEYAESDTVFPLENLKVCSLSNGPGLDIAGLLCALYKSEKNLKCFPQLKAINLYDSWLNMYNSIVKLAYEEISLKSLSGYLHIPSENVHVIQSDIYSQISPDAEKVISDSNVLLMLRVFVSAKATPDVFSNTLKKIFSLLKPGALIFFIGSKHNTRNFSKDTLLGSSVKCIFGPQKVTLENLPIKQDFVKNLTVNPQDSGFGYFIVWQKREVGIPIEIIKNKKKTRRKKKKALKTGPNQKDDSMVDELIDDTDAGSEVSFTSCSKLSDSLSDDLKSSSLTSTSDEINTQNHKRESQSNVVYSMNDVISQLDRIHVADMELQSIKYQSTSDVKYINLEGTNLRKEPETVIVENLIETQPLKNLSCEDGNMNQMQNIERTQNKISLNVSRSARSFSSGDKVYLDNLNDEKRSTDNMQTMFSPFMQNKVKKADTPTKKISESKNSNTPTKVNTGVRNSKNIPKTTLQSNASVSQSCENIFRFPRNIVDMQNGNDVQRLIQQCGSLITSLEKMTDDIKREICSRNDQCFVKKCCTDEGCCRSRVKCCSSSCNMQFCCHKKCNVMKNICAACTNSLSCESNAKEIHDCCSESKRFKNSRPYIVIPL